MLMKSSLSVSFISLVLFGSLDTHNNLLLNL